MTAWEYLFLDIRADGYVRKAENVIVTTSDGRWKDTRMPTTVIGILNQVGAEGWEMVNSSGSNNTAVHVTPQIDFSATFKRPRP